MKEQFRAQFHSIRQSRQISLRTARALGLALKTVVNVDEYWVTVDFGDGWRAALRLMPHGGSVVVGELRVYPADEFPDQVGGQWSAEFLGVQAWKKVERMIRVGITARLLRHVPMGSHLRYARQLISELGRSGQWGTLEADGLYREGPERRERSDRRPDLFYARLADDYTARVAAGSRRPVADLAERRKLPASVIRDAVHTARERGFLTDGMSGTPGGLLTPKATKLLSSQKRGRGKR